MEEHVEHHMDLLVTAVEAEQPIISSDKINGDAVGRTTFSPI